MPIFQRDHCVAHGVAGLCLTCDDCRRRHSVLQSPVLLNVPEGIFAGMVTKAIIVRDVERSEAQIAQGRSHLPLSEKENERVRSKKNKISNGLTVKFNQILPFFLRLKDLPLFSILNASFAEL